MIHFDMWIPVYISWMDVDLCLQHINCALAVYVLIYNKLCSSTNKTTYVQR